MSIFWDDFVKWQCNLRQNNFRKDKGLPSEGTLAKILYKNTNIEILTIRSILIEKKYNNTLKMFEFMFKKTHDPEERYLKAVKFFSSEYFDDPKIFDGSFTATFSKDSSILKKILIKKKFNVQFFQDNMGFDFEVKVIKLKKKEPLWLFTFFHNSFFNPQLNEDIEILYFKPEITSAKKII
ncbi:MAG: hypothetical protein CFH19_01140 [Alphaproteobacteria bacterium MarineAlpha5_Bin9]|nr:MAG: hypothetical protein CFH19_01140 [Alphaproteobacteria bacterium MarineAlpha5_Bin9]|tara:strand:- start:1531 stop:2073 length:543 start_codon:yes stop_codon:yes gene_type:complete